MDVGLGWADGSCDGPGNSWGGYNLGSFVCAQVSCLLQKLTLCNLVREKTHMKTEFKSTVFAHLKCVIAMG